MFHSDVSDDFVEFFISDMLKNCESLIELFKQYNLTDNKDVKRDIVKATNFILEILGEENKMLHDLYQFRDFTEAELDQIYIISELVQKKEFEKMIKLVV